MPVPPAPPPPPPPKRPSTGRPTGGPTAGTGDRGGPAPGAAPSGPPAPPPPAATAPARVTAFRADGAAGGVGRDDVVAVEAPLEVRVGGSASVVLLRTPGHDDELVRGFLLSEGVIRSADDVVRLERPTGIARADVGHVVDVTLFPSPDRPALDRGLFGSSSCGPCGKRTIASLAIDAPPCASAMRVAWAVLAGLPARMRPSQRAFDATGGVHASALFRADGTLVALREDVGRHNAVDKLVGWALVAGRLPLDGHVLVLSGRVSYDLVQKAVLAGIPIVVAVGAPSSLAVDVATRYGITLAGFARDGGVNVYAHGERILA